MEEGPGRQATLCRRAERVFEMWGVLRLGFIFGQNSQKSENYSAAFLKADQKCRA